MSSYISTHSITNSLRQSVLKMQTDLAARQTEVATGEHADLGLSLGGRSEESVSLQAQKALIESITQTNTVTTTRLAVMQNHLSNLQTAAQSTLNTLLSTNFSTSGAQSAQTTGEDGLRGLIAELNSSLNGAYLFAGTNTAQAPLTDYYQSGSATKSAVDSSFVAAFGTTQASAATSNISGGDMANFLEAQFHALFQGANWTGAWSSASDDPMVVSISPDRVTTTSVSANAAPFKALAQAYTMLADLGAKNLSQSAYGALVSKARGLLSDGIAGLTEIQAGVGVTQSRISASSSQMSLQMNILSTQVGNLENVNTYDVQMRVSELQTQIETAFSLTSQLKDISLLKYL